jgi:hypothetical protein
VYRPERWEVRGPEDEARVKTMNGTMLQFGMGSRTCIGKNISLLEIYKLVPTMLRRFEVWIYSLFPKVFAGNMLTGADPARRPQRRVGYCQRVVRQAAQLHYAVQPQGDCQAREGGGGFGVVMLTWQRIVSGFFGCVSCR